MTDVGTPEDGDLIRPAPKIAVPADVAEAVATLIRWAGDDPAREGLRSGKSTPCVFPRFPRAINWRPLCGNVAGWRGRGVRCRTG